MDPTARAAVNDLIALHWQPMHACGAVANLQAESGLNPGARGDYNRSHQPTAFGICQWHEDRVAAILHGCGVDVRHADLAEQLKALDWEMRHTQQQAFASVAQSTSAFNAGYEFCKYFERPADIPLKANQRGAAAARLFEEFRA